MLSMLLSSNFIHAETSKQLKSDKKTTDVNKTMTNDEFMKQFMTLDKKEKDAEKKLEETRKLRKTVDELGKQVGVNNKKDTQIKLADENNSQSFDDRIGEIMKLKQRQLDAKARTIESKAKLAESERKLEAARQLRKTVDELANTLGVKE